MQRDPAAGGSHVEGVWSILERFEAAGTTVSARSSLGRRPVAWRVLRYAGAGSLSATRPVAGLARWVEVRWRIEHGYRDLGYGLCLDHCWGGVEFPAAPPRCPVTAAQGLAPAGGPIACAAPAPGTVAAPADHRMNPRKVQVPPGDSRSASWWGRRSYRPAGRMGLRCTTRCAVAPRRSMPALWSSGRERAGEAGCRSARPTGPLGSRGPPGEVTAPGGLLAPLRGLPGHFQESWFVDTNCPGITRPLARSSV